MTSELVCFGGTCGHWQRLVGGLGRARLRVWTQSQPEHVDSSERDSVAKRSGELVVSCGHTAKVLEAADRRLDPPSLLVRLFVMADFDDPVLLARNDGLDAVIVQGLPKDVGIIGAIGDEALAASDFGEQHLDAPDIAMMTRCQVDGDRSSQEVGGEMDFG